MHRSDGVQHLPAARAAPGSHAAFLILGFVIIVALLPRGAWLPFGIAALGLVGLYASVPASARRDGLWRWLKLEPLAIGVAVLSFFQPDGAGVFASLVIKSTLCIGAMAWLAAAVGFTAWLAGWRRIGIPALLITILMLMYRYLEVLLEELHTLRRARQSRTFRPGRSREWHALSAILAQLFVRTADRADRVYAAMRARGWEDGTDDARRVH